jgi:ribosomal protein S8
MAPAAKVVTVPLQHAIWSRAPHATCKLTPLNKALAHALYRTSYISWVTESGAHPPDASILKEFSPDELKEMHIAHTQNRNKRQLWMGLRYRSPEWKRDNGWWESKQVPVIKTILSKSLKDKNDPIDWSADEVARFAAGESLGTDMWRRGLGEGQAAFFKIEGENKDEPEHKWKKVEVLESREAAKRGVGGSMVCRVWPHRRRVAKKDEGAAGQANEAAEREQGAAKSDADVEAEAVKVT